MKTKVCRKWEWLRPYVELGMGFISEGKKLDKVGHWTIGKRYGKGIQAAIFTDDDKSYRIYLHSHIHPRNSKKLKLSKIEILLNLSHELAHMEEWDHTPRHSTLESQIQIAFMKKLREDGYISEEVELEQ